MFWDEVPDYCLRIIIYALSVIGSWYIGNSFQLSMGKFSVSEKIQVALSKNCF